MSNKSIVPALFLALLSNTALAGELVIDIPAGGAQPVDTSITVNPSSSNAAENPVKVNTGAILATIDETVETLDGSLNLGAVDGEDHGNSNGLYQSTAAANALADDDGNYAGNNLNAVVFENTHTGDAEALIGSINYNTGTVTATIDGLDLSAEALSVQNGADISTDNNTLRARAIINAENNYITGDISASTSTGTSGSPVTITAPISTTTPATNGSARANADLVIAAYQTNEETGAASATIQNLGLDTDVADLDEDSSLSIQGNALVAATEVNLMNNVIDVVHPGLGLDFAIAAYQHNDATAESIVDIVDMSIAAGTGVNGSARISNNDIAAATFVNVMNNEVTSDSGGEDGSANFVLWQDNAGAVTSTVSNLNMSRDGGSSTATGDLSLTNNSVSATALANAMDTRAEFASSNADPANYAGKIGGYQVNSGALTARVSGVDMSATVAGTSSSVGGRGNSITVSAVANSATNIIRLK